MAKAARPVFKYTDLRGDALIDPLGPGKLLHPDALQATEAVGYVPPPTEEPSSPLRPSDIPDYLIRQPFHLPEQPEAIRPGMLHGRTSRVGTPPSRTLSQPDEDMIDPSEEHSTHSEAIRPEQASPAAGAPPTPPRPTRQDCWDAELMLYEARLHPAPDAEGNESSVFYLRQSNSVLVVNQEVEDI